MTVLQKTAGISLSRLSWLSSTWLCGWSVPSIRWIILNIHIQVWKCLEVWFIFSHPNSSRAPISSKSTRSSPSPCLDAPWRRPSMLNCTALWWLDWPNCWALVYTLDQVFWRHIVTHLVCTHTHTWPHLFIFQIFPSVCIEITGGFCFCRRGDKTWHGGTGAACAWKYWSKEKVNIVSDILYFFHVIFFLHVLN